MNTENKRIIYLDYLRILATIAVIILHVSVQNFYIDVNTYEWKVFNFYDAITRWAVPIFVMISGVLFLDNNKNITIKNLYLKNILRIATSLIFWSAIYVIFSLSVNPNQDIKKIITSFISGHYHQWFLFMIIGIYIITPILRKIVESEKIIKYFLIISFIFSFCIPNLLKLPYISVFENAYNNMKFHLTLGYSSYFILGYYINKKDISKKNQNIIYILGILAFIATIVLNGVVSIYKNTASSGFYDEFTINVLFQSIAVFVFSKYKLTNTSISEKNKKIVYKLSKYSFGVYLIHVLIMDILNLYGINTLSFNALISVPTITVIVYIISILVSKLLNSIPVLNKYIV